MKIKDKKTIATIVAITVTLIILAISAPRIKTSLIGEMEAIYKVKSNIREGEEIKEDNLIQSEINKLSIPKNAVRNKKDIVGKIAKTDIFNYDYITKDKLAKLEEEVYYKKEDKIMAITLQSQAAGVSGQLKKGDVVSILGYSQDNDGLELERISDYLELKAVEVLSVTTPNLKDVDKIDKNQDLTINDLPATVILKIKDDIQAKRIAELEYGSKIHLTIAGRGIYGQELLAEQDEVIKKQKELAKLDELEDIENDIESGVN